MEEGEEDPDAAVIATLDLLLGEYDADRLYNVLRNICMARGVNISVGSTSVMQAAIIAEIAEKDLKKVHKQLDGSSPLGALAAKNLHDQMGMVVIDLAKIARLLRPRT